VTLYAVAVSAHVVIAIVGLGVFGAVPIGAATTRRAGLGLVALEGWVKPLFLCTRISLLLLLLTGALLDFVAKGAFHDAFWFRLSVALLVVAAIGQALARGTLRRGLAGQIEESRALFRIERLGFTSAAAVACIAVLMEIKPL
jgi:hypothetical protein